MPLYQFVEKLLLIKYLVYRFWTRSSTLHLLLKKDSGFASSNIFLIFEQNPQVWPSVKKMCLPHTGKSLSEALIFASANPQYNNRVFIELQVQHMKIPSSNLGRICCVQKLFLTFRTIFVNIMISQSSAKRRASDKDLPVLCDHDRFSWFIICWW